MQNLQVAIWGRTDRMSRIRQGGGVKRWHIRPVIGEQTVAAHTWGVIAVLFEITEPSAELVKAALYHDVTEFVTGDLPYTAKAGYEDLRGLLDKIEYSLEQELRLNTAITEEEKWYLKCADRIEMCYFSLEQLRMGNTNFREVFCTAYDGIGNLLKGRAFCKVTAHHQVLEDQFAELFPNEPSAK